MLRTCRPGIHFRGISRFVYLTAMTKAGSNAGFFTATYVFLSSGTVIQILHTGLITGAHKWHIFSKILNVTFPLQVWHSCHRERNEKHMKNIKTHSGLLIHKEQTRRVRLHETPSAWRHTRRECYSKTTGRCGSPDSLSRLILSSIQAIE